MAEYYAQPNAISGQDRTSDNVDAIFGAGGKKIKAIKANWLKQTTDGNGTLVRLFRDIPPHVRLLALLLGNDAMVGLTSARLGLYPPGLGSTSTQQALFATGLDLTTARLLAPATALNGLSALNNQQIGGKMLWELALATSGKWKRSYDIMLELVTAGAAAGNVDALLLFAEE